MLLPSVNYLAYKNALKQAWKDGKMSADESAMLDTLRKSLNISAEDHMNIEKEVRNELAGILNNPNPGFNNNPNPRFNGGAGAGAANNGYGNGGGVDNNEIKRLLTAGKNSYHKGNYEEAIDYCDQVLLIDPDNSEALFFRKRTLSKVEKLGGRGAGKKTEMDDEDLESEEMGEVGADELESEEDDLESEIDVELGSQVANNNSTPDTTSNNKTAIPTKGDAPSEGDPNCKSCGGSGECHWCQGSGKCYWCKGTGNCEKCKGTGKVDGEDCKSCKGAGKCHSCMGDGSCYWCKGTGKCNKCAL